MLLVAVVFGVVVVGFAMVVGTVVFVVAVVDVLFVGDLVASYVDMNAEYVTHVLPWSRWRV